MGIMRKFLTTKTFFTLSLFIAGVASTGIVAAGLIVLEDSKQNNTLFSNGTAGPQTANQIVETSGSAGNSKVVLSLQELSLHNSASSCWLLISGKLYDVTSFISQHPGGARGILSTCGTDATQAFLTQGGQGSHSSFATGLLTSYYIGDLGQSATPLSEIPPPPLPKRDDDDEEEDD